MLNKKILIFTILIILVLGALTFAFFYYQYQQKTQKIDVEQEVERKTCREKAFTTIIDGTFKQIKDSSLYLKLKEQKEIKSINLTDDTRFFELYFSSGGTPNLVGQKEIKKEDLNAEDELSVIASYNTEKPDEYSALTVRHMMVQR